MADHTPTLRQQLLALLVAGVCAVGFLRSGLRLDHALLPYPPEVLEPWNSAAKTSGMDPAEIYRGNLTMGDKYNQSLTWDRITHDRMHRAQIPLWTRDIAGGVPFVPQMGQVYHPFNLLLLVVPSTGVYGVWYFLHLLLLGWTAYRFLRQVGVHHGPALFGVVAVTLGLWTQARLHHNVMLSAVLPVFVMLAATHRLFLGNGRLGTLAVLATCTGLSWICGFAPASLMCTYLVGGYALLLWWTAPGGRRARPLLQFGAAIGLGLLASSAHLLPVLWAARDSSRLPATQELLANKALEPAHLLTAVWPSLFSWPSDHFYLPAGKLHNTWPALALLDRELQQSAFNYPETAFYPGIAPLLLAVYGCRGRLGWFLFGAALFGLAMALGLLLPVSRFLPGAHSGDLKRFLLLFGITVPLLAALGLQRVLVTGRRRLLIGIGLCLAVFSLELFLLHLYPHTALREIYGDLARPRLERVFHVTLPEDAMAQWVRDYPGEGDVNRARLLLGFGAAALCAALTVLILWWRSRFSVGLLCAMTGVELVWAGIGPVVAVPRDRLTTLPPILAPVRAAERPNGVRPRLQRLLGPHDGNLGCPVPPNLGAFYGVEDLGAYNPLPKRRMEELFLALEPDFERDPGSTGQRRRDKASVVLGGAGVSALRDSASLTHPLADLLGLEFVLTRSSLGLPGLVDRTPADAAPGFHLYQRTTCLPRATLVREAVVVTEPQERLRRLGDRAHDPRHTVLLEDPTASIPTTGPTTGSEVEILHHGDQKVFLRTRAEFSAYLRLADPYDAGWTATVDDRPAEVLVADHYFRAVYLPAGEHRIAFRYNGPSVRVPQWISLAAALLIAALAASSLRQSGRRRNSESTHDLSTRD